MCPLAFGIWTCFLACGWLVDECDALDLHGDLPTSNIFVTAAVHNRAHVSKRKCFSIALRHILVV